MSYEHEPVIEPQPSNRRRRETAWYSLLGAVIVALFVLGIWWTIRAGADGDIALQRRISDTNVVWQCPEGHTFEGRGSHVRLPCPECNRSADMRTTYECPTHGVRQALFRVIRLPDGRERVSQISFRRGVWSDVNSTIVCPDCGAPLKPPSTKPFVAPPSE